MNRTLINCLLQLGCGEKHIKFYRANLELGAAPLMDIAKKARLQRSTAYITASEMDTMGLVSEDHKAYRKLFTAAEPDRLLQKLEAKQRQIGRNTIALREILPELRATYQTTINRPRVRTFEGRASLPTIWKDILSQPQEILLWTNQDTESQVFDEKMHNQFIAERLRQNIPIRVLAVNNPKGQALTETDSVNMRETRLLPATSSFTSETYIYGNKVAILDIGKDIFGVITENEQIAQSQRAIFELAWTTMTNE